MAGAIIHDGKLLLVREQGVIKFPGGAMEEGETEVECLRREIKEETCVGISSYAPLFEVEGPSPYDSSPVHVKMYFLEIEGEPSQGDGVEEFVWMRPNDNHDDLLILTKLIFVRTITCLRERGYL